MLTFLNPWLAVRPGDTLVVRRTGGKLTTRIRVAEVENPGSPLLGLTSRPAFVWGTEITRSGQVRQRAARGRATKSMNRVVRYLFMHEIVEIIRKEN